jgi:hypothetical protein
MEISIEEFQRLADDKTSQAVRAAELKRQLAEKTSECELLKCRVSVLEADNEKARIEILLLRNYITLSVEKIRAFMKRLNSLDRFAFLKTFLECALPKEHYQEQLMRVNEVMTIPEEPKAVVPVQNNFAAGSGCQVFNGEVTGDFDKK